MTDKWIKDDKNDYVVQILLLLKKSAHLNLVQGNNRSDAIIDHTLIIYYTAEFVKENGVQEGLICGSKKPFSQLWERFCYYSSEFIILNLKR